MARGEQNEGLEEVFVDAGDKSESAPILYRAHLQEDNLVNYDSVLLAIIGLVLCWFYFIGILVWLYIPYRRWYFRKQVESTELYITPENLVLRYETPSCASASRPRSVHFPLRHIVQVDQSQSVLQAKFGLDSVYVHTSGGGARFLFGAMYHFAGNSDIIGIEDSESFKQCLMKAIADCRRPAVGQPFLK
mmetsp:Transcript_29672/g.82898  ORF Transcript_29672/g.82898 Transcript_29672/m.82898 type:complete len:190 (+) Transcript_29672:110-679(+)